ncbi:hypothetical protein Q5752_005021 [Cryptotrichosporon argae]
MFCACPQQTHTNIFTDMSQQITVNHEWAKTVVLPVFTWKTTSSQAEPKQLVVFQLDRFSDGPRIHPKFDPTAAIELDAVFVSPEGFDPNSKDAFEINRAGLCVWTTDRNNDAMLKQIFISRLTGATFSHQVSEGRRLVHEDTLTVNGQVLDGSLIASTGRFSEKGGVYSLEVTDRSVRSMPTYKYTFSKGDVDESFFEDVVERA